ncbi:prepilin-type N-terminal cleavage/methylation domain-containing protein [Lederbergia wuyishanensis]|uniref:Prepilin-type N-terminal cleavage/methylation domain-containing protein n=1 Tax=Lederbergia wuyishanensis TaxID=1347903 RepID=A0ABU0D1V7_9BACI|nr:prepilin-type N-terminal cleavage/methylation domain-containing protein [Lederbergia wuyishanensis]MCJ8006996.1 type II secretion system GspH family protein [Lederbergia wuyishanensis]MDQ0342380.1 prepilin-type N-terminal cleavage/methylation domain-containing protein [Lederbergia wuyishanensis]
MEKMIRRYLNHKGLTLIEILASITILAIVIISFLTFFSQTMLFSSKAEDRVTSINIADKILYNVKNDLVVYTGDTRVISGELYKEIEPVYINKKTYYPYVNQTQETPESLNLSIVHVLIFVNKNDKSAMSELFSYIKSEGHHD